MLRVVLVTCRRRSPAYTWLTGAHRPQLGCIEDGNLSPSCIGLRLSATSFRCRLSPSFASSQIPRLPCRCRPCGRRGGVAHRPGPCWAKRDRTDARLRTLRLWKGASSPLAQKVYDHLFGGQRKRESRQEQDFVSALDVLRATLLGRLFASMPSTPEMPPPMTR